MSILWITSYLLIVILGASLVIISYLRLELWLQTRRVRSRRHQNEQKHLRVDSVPGTVTAAGVHVDARSVATGNFTKSPGVQVLLKRDGGPKPGADSVKGRPVPGRKMPVSKTESLTEKSASAGQVSASHSGSPPSTATNARSNARQDQAQTKSETTAGRGSDRKHANQAPSSPQVSPLAPGVTLDDLYDREVPTFITSELVGEDEAQQELSPDDIIEAEVL